MMKKLCRQLGFTLIELVIVIGIIGLIMPALLAIVFGVIRQQSKVLAIKQAKREGDFLLSAMGNTIRNNAIAIYSGVPQDDNSNQKCDGQGESFTRSDAAPMYLKDRYGKWLSYNPVTVGSDYTKIASSSSIPDADADLTSNKVDVQRFTLSCDSTSAFSPPILSISFTILYNTNSARPEDIGSLNYQTKIKLRSY